MEPSGALWCGPTMAEPPSVRVNYGGATQPQVVLREPSEVWGEQPQAVSATFRMKLDEKHKKQDCSCRSAASLPAAAQRPSQCGGCGVVERRAAKGSSMRARTRLSLRQGRLGRMS